MKIKALVADTNSFKSWKDDTEFLFLLRLSVINPII